MITYQDYERAENKLKWLRNAITTYRNSEEYKRAVEEEEYMAGRNVEILKMMRIIYDMAGLPAEDFTKHNIKVRNRLIHRLVTDRCSYSLGNGISFASKKKEIVGGETRTVDRTKKMMGPKFDRMVKRTAYWALANGTSYLYVHRGFNKPDWQYTLFKKTEFLALYDEETGALRGGVRFWSLDWGKRPITAVLYTEAGYEKYRTEEGKYGIMSLVLKEKLRPYIETVEESEAYGEEVTGAESLTMLPIFPMYSGENKEGALGNMKDKLDAYDMILSGFANDVVDIPQVYWLISGAMGMSEGDKRQLLDRLILQHMAVVDGENSKIQGYTQDIPVEAREKSLKLLRNQIYEDWGGFDVHTIEAGSTNDHIDAGYQPMDEEADDFEYEVIELVQQILAMMGVEDTPLFKRNKVSNQKEQTDMVIESAPYLDDQTILEKLPFITVDEVDAILQRKDAESYSRFDDANDEDEEEEEEDEGGEA